MHFNAHDLTILGENPLFAAFRPEERRALLEEQRADTRRFAPGERILAAGQEVRALHFLLEGAAHIEQLDYLGRRHLISDLRPGMLFGESFALAANSRSHVDVVAREHCLVLSLSQPLLPRVRASREELRRRWLERLLLTLAEKNLYLNQKLRILSRRRLDEKILRYFSELAAEQGSETLTLPFDRQGLADYLAADRSALSRKLSELQARGLFTLRGRRLRLRGTAEP